MSPPPASSRWPGKEAIFFHPARGSGYSCGKPGFRRKPERSALRRCQFAPAKTFPGAFRTNLWPRVCALGFPGAVRVEAFRPPRKLAEVPAGSKAEWEWTREPRTTPWIFHNADIE